MSRIIVEYNPPLSLEGQKAIQDGVTPSMVSNDETSCQYDISLVCECLGEVLGLLNPDLMLINQYIKEGVHYIEI